VPLVPGGSVDSVARVLAQKMAESMGQQVVVDNRGGASGNIGTELAVHAAPDGYTILTVSMTLVVNQFLFPKLPFDVVHDLAPVSLIGAAPLVLTVHPSVPVHSPQELIALARKNPGKLNYASSGKGTNSHLSMELFKYMTRTDIVAVPYRGGGPGQIALLAGEVDVGLNNLPIVTPHFKTGRLRPLAITTMRRSAALPELPTVSEAGVPGYSFTTWYGVLVPAATPPGIIDALHGHIVRALRTPEMGQRFSYEGAEIIASTPAQFAAHIRNELEKWTQVVRKAGIEPQ